MYKREEASLLKQAFWTAFGKYISPQPSAEGLRINWINYKTGVKHVYFRMEADKNSATIAIEIAHPDAGIQELFYEQFAEYKNIFASYLDEDWIWELHGRDENGKTVSRIYLTLENVNLFTQDDWPALISFFKPRIILLDQFWTDVKYGFDELK